MACMASVFQICRAGSRPGRMPLTRESSNARAKTRTSGVTVTWIGYSEIGCQRVSVLSSATAKNVPAMPPQKETSTASVRTWRNSLHREEPMESRIASSRARSAERAAKIPARLTHAAASTSRASTMMAARKGRAGPPSRSPINPGLLMRRQGRRPSPGFRA